MVARLIGSRYNEHFRINMSEYFGTDDNGLYQKITPSPNLLFEDSALIIFSKIDKKAYDFTGVKLQKRSKRQ